MTEKTNPFAGLPGQDNTSDGTDGSEAVETGDGDTGDEEVNHEVVQTSISTEAAHDAVALLNAYFKSLNRAKFGALTKRALKSLGDLTDSIRVTS